MSDIAKEGFDPDASLAHQVLVSVAANTKVDLQVDAPLIGAAVKIAQQVDRVIELVELGVMPPEQLTKALYLLPHLSNHLKEMLATPASRHAAEKDKGTPPSGASKLAQMREDAQRGPRDAAA